MHSGNHRSATKSEKGTKFLSEECVKERGNEKAIRY